MKVQFETENGLTLIRPEFNSLDVSTARAFRREVMANVSHDARVILDMSRVEFVDPERPSALQRVEDGTASTFT